MSTVKKVTGIVLATAAAGLFAAAPVAMADAHEGKVHCTGVNACKGTSECKTATNACKGQNSCKGKGFISMSAKDCQDKGGKVEGEKEAH
jgi:hypothetical protein